jgi:hypothetical protein
MNTKLRGCCAARTVNLIAALKHRLVGEHNPDVRRGLQIAIYEIKTGHCAENEKEELE